MWLDAVHRFLADIGAAAEAAFDHNADNDDHVATLYEEGWDFKEPLPKDGAR